MAEMRGHPLGVEPLGNAYLDEEKGVQHVNVRKGVGASFPSKLRSVDDIWLNVVSFLSADDLLSVRCVSKAWYTFASVDEVWRELAVLQSSERKQSLLIHESGFWFPTFWMNFSRLQQLEREYKPLSVKGVFSDELYQRARCAAVSVREVVSETSNVDRRSASSLTVKSFFEEYAVPGRPVVITGVVESWAAAKKWTKERLISLGGEQLFKAGKALFTLEDYFRYCHYSKDESPLYLFDNEFQEKVSDFRTDYEVPAYFRSDFFDGVQNHGRKRPSYKWILIGPPKSGSSFHKDPNCTSAWNGLISGRKKWLMYAPDVTPPGIFPSFDGADVTAPISVTEWFLSFYDRRREASGKLIEFVQEPGDLVFIPQAWWHTAYNLEESIAVTQNFVDRSNVRGVLAFLKKHGKTSLLDALNLNLSALDPDFYKTLIEEKRGVDWSSMQMRAKGGNDDEPFVFQF